MYMWVGILMDLMKLITGMMMITGIWKEEYYHSVDCTKNCVKCIV